MMIRLQDDARRTGGLLPPLQAAQDIDILILMPVFCRGSLSWNANSVSLCAYAFP